ncbi:MAG: DUF1385 domain-containing protein [Lachnospiraceae bacterium]|nr:DUF1385 domain-containing protein [Lachnospiraceae bacterium]
MAGKSCGRSCGIGGQAVLEGVMMKNQEKCAVAIRKVNEQIEVKEMDYKACASKSKIFQIPFVRGFFNFLDSLVLGTKCLNYSASFFEEEQPVHEESAGESFLGKVFGEKAESVVMGMTMVFSLVIAVALFMILPYYLAELLGRVVRNASLLSLFEGLIRIAIFILYVVAISLMKDIQRVYMYHGAEHKCINCIERGRILNVENVMKSSRLHMRCGTSFMLFVMFVSVVLFFFIRVDSRVLRVVLRILLLPVISGISYEIIRLAGKSDNIIVRILSAPGLALQKLTTKEPDEKMVEVAIASVEAVFDWKDYFKKTFDYTVDEDPESETEESRDNEL